MASAALEVTPAHAPEALLRRCVACARDGAQALQAVCAAAAVCRALRHAAEDDSLWHALALRLWPGARALADAPRGWRAFVRARTLAQRRFDAQPCRASAWQLSDYTLLLDVHDAATLLSARKHLLRCCCP
jgi:hypothetical protein